MSQVFFFPNGNTAYFDEDGNQVPQFQRSWFLTYCEFLEERGIDPTKVGKFTMPNQKIAHPFRTFEGNLNWHFEPEVDHD